MLAHLGLIHDKEMKLEVFKERKSPSPPAFSFNKSGMVGREDRDDGDSDDGGTENFDRHHSSENFSSSIPTI